MTTFVLILMIQSTYLDSKGTSNVLTSVPGFVSIEECKQAGKDAGGLIRSAEKDVRFVCVKQTKADK